MMNRRRAALLLCVALVVAFADADRVKLTEKQRYRDAWDMIVGEEFGLPSRSPPPTAPPGPSPPMMDAKEPVPMTIVDPLRETATAAGTNPTSTATAPPPNPPTPPSPSSSVPHTSVASDAAHPSRAVPVPPPTEPPIHAVSTSPTSKLPFASATASSSVPAPAPAPAPASTSAPAINTGPMHHRPMTPTPIPHPIRKPRPPLRHRFGHPVPVPVRVIDDAHKSNLSPSAATAKKGEAPTMTTEEVMKELRRYSAIIDLNKRNRAAAVAAGKPVPPIMHAAPFSRTTAVTPQSTTPVPSLSHTLEELAKEVVALRKQHNDDDGDDDKKAAAEAAHTQMEHMILPRPTLVPIAHDHAHEHAHVHGPTSSDAEAITDELHRDCNRPIEFVLRFSGSCAFPPHSSTPTSMPAKTPVPYRGYHFRKYQTSAPTPAAGAAVPNCTLSATSQALRTRISPIQGVHMHVYPLIGAHAKLSVFDLEILSEKAFTARGELQFGSTRLKPHTIGFESAGAAHVFKFKAGERSFSAQFRVTGGEHEFKGSTGVVSVNGRMTGPHRVEALVSGVIIPAEALKPRSVTLSPTPPAPTPTPPKTDDQIARDRVVEHRRDAVREWVAKQRKQFEHTNTSGPSVRV